MKNQTPENFKTNLENGVVILLKKSENGAKKSAIGSMKYNDCLSQFDLDENCMSYKWIPDSEIRDPVFFVNQINIGICPIK